MACPTTRGCIPGGPEMEKHVSGATYAGGWLVWEGLAGLTWGFPNRQMPS